jgi:deoxyribodipyrimidine photo-lyase
MNHQVSTTATVPASRIRSINRLPCRADGQWVIYWMTAFRRIESNFALQYARDWAVELKRPLLILEGLRTDYEWASDRLHQFILEGMRDNAKDCADAGVFYFPYVEPRRNAARGLLRTLTESACIIIGDDYPCFFYPEMYGRLADRLPCRLDLVDSNCLMPLSVADRTFTVAHSYRRWMQKVLPSHLAEKPEATPLKSTRMKELPRLKAIPASVCERWQPADLECLIDDGGINRLPIDHSVKPVSSFPGGSKAARIRLNEFMNHRLVNYDQDRNEPDHDGSTQLSPYLHFGHLSCQELFSKIMESQNWSLDKIRKPNGKMQGFWGASQNTEALLDQLCTWREIGFNMCYRQRDYDQYESLPHWAIQTLSDHQDDPRPAIYSLEQFERAETHDPLWNAAQRQLLQQGRIHNYLRMLWGKKILHWTESPRQALQFMIELNNKYALDGRDPNSYSGIFWVLGRYDRAWGPEREVFGKIRYMTSENTARKHSVSEYLKRFSSDNVRIENDSASRKSG